jgi:hypothetical protein
MNSFLQLALGIVLLTACHDSQSDDENADASLASGQAQCETTTRVIEPAQVSALGFSVEDQFESLGLRTRGEATCILEWLGTESDATKAVTPATGTTSLMLKFAQVGVVTEAIGMRVDQSLERLTCLSSLTTTLDISVTSGDGAFVAAVSAPLVFMGPPTQGQFGVVAPVDEMGGSYMFDFSRDWPATGKQVALTFSHKAISGAWIEWGKSDTTGYDDDAEDEGVRVTTATWTCDNLTQ